MNSSQLRRVQTIADLMRRSNSALQENTEAANGIAISFLHDAIEQTFYMILLDFNQSPKPREEFKELVKAVATLFLSKASQTMPFQRQLDDLNSQRVSFKHRGTRPTRNAALEMQSYGIEFLTVAFQTFYSFKIQDFHPAEFLRIDAVRVPLVEARNALGTDSFDDAMCQIALANYRIDEAFGVIFGPPRPPLRIDSPFGEGADFRRDLLDFIRQSDQHTLITAVLIASGQDVAAYTSARWRLPVVHAFVGGNFSYDKIVPNPYTADDVNFCMEQIERLAVWMEERFSSLSFADGRWQTGSISPWPN